MASKAQDPAKPLREELSVRAFAKRIGVSHTAVRKAILDGRLRQGLVHRGRRVLVEPVAAAADYHGNTDPTKQRELEERAGGVAPGTKPPNAGRKRQQPGLYGPELEAAAREAGVQLEPGARGPNLQEVRRQHISLQAQLAQLELDERQGKLVRANEVRAEAFRMAREVRNALALLPNRLAPMLAAETDPHTIRQVLAQEISAALESLAAPAAPTAPEAASG